MKKAIAVLFLVLFFSLGHRPSYAQFSAVRFCPETENERISCSQDKTKIISETLSNGNVTSTNEIPCAENQECLQDRSIASCFICQTKSKSITGYIYNAESRQIISVTNSLSDTSVSECETDVLTVTACSNNPNFGTYTGKDCNYKGVKHAIFTSATCPAPSVKSWNFNVKLSCENGSAPIDTLTNPSWNFLNSSNSTCSQERENKSESTTEYTINISQNPSNSPTCSTGLFYINKDHTAEALTFSYASSSSIVKDSSNPQAARWDLASLPSGDYTLNYFLPRSSCPEKPSSPPPCPLKSQGDANCDGKINIQDFLIWKTEFLDNRGNHAPNNSQANFDDSDIIDINDFLIWKTGFLNPNIAH